MVKVERRNPNNTVKEIKLYPSTKKGKAAMAKDSKHHLEQYDNGVIDFKSPNWPA